MTDMPVEAKAAFLAKVTENGTEPLPTENDLLVEALVRLAPSVGIADLDAGYRIDITNSDACFAMEPDDDEYHRPDCEVIDGVVDLKFSLTPRLDGEENDRKPCQTCKPHLWDVEAKKGVAGGG